MKPFYKHLLFVCILFQIELAKTQNSNLSIQTGSMAAQGVVSIHHKSFILFASYAAPGCCSFEGHFQGRGANNSLLFDVPLTYEQGTSIGKIYVGANKTILLYQGTRNKGCDYGGYRYKVVKFDTLGNAVFTFTTSDGISQLLPKSNGGFFMQVGDLIKSYSANGLPVGTFSLGTGGIVNSLALLNNGNLLVNYTWNSFVRYKTVDTLGNVLSDVVMNPACTLMKEGNNGNLYTLSAGVVSKYTSTLGLLASTTGSVTILNFDLNQDTLYAIVTNTLGQSGYAVIDSQLNTIYQAPLNLYPTYLSDITYTKETGKTKIVGTGIYAVGGSHGILNLFTMAKYGQFTAKRDVGVVAVQASVTAIAGFSYYPNPIMFYEPRYNATASVQNFGADTIHYFRLNFYGYRSGLFPCRIGFSQGYTVTVAPGATVAVQTPTFSSSTLRQDMLAADGSFTVPICIYATTPDEFVDEVFLNNGACTTLRVETMGIESSEGEQSVSVFPNPTTAQVYITSPHTISKVGLVDAMGRLVIIDKAQQNSAVIDLSGKPAGIYFAEIYCGSSVLRKKIIKQ